MSANPELKTVKVPQNLCRAATVTVTGEGEQRQTRISISSDTPYLRYDWWNDEEYWEVLDHSPGGFVDSRLKAGLPGLYNHRRDFHLSRAKSYSCDGHRIEVSDIIWSTSEEAQQKKSDHDAGVLVDTSVGYSLIGDGECVGAKDGIPVYKFKWEPHEFSLVTIPADITVGSGRQRDHKPEGEPREIQVRNLIDGNAVINQKANTDQPPMKLNPLAATHFRNKDENGGGVAAPPVDAKAERANAIAEFKQRCKRIDEHAAAMRNDKWREIATTVANKHKEGEADFAAYRDDVNNAIDAYTSSQTQGRGEGASGIQVIGDRPQNPQQRGGGTIGQRFVNSKDFQARGGDVGRRRTIGLDVEFPMLGARGRLEMQARAGFNSSDLTAVNVAPQMGIVELGTQQPSILDLITPGTTSAAAIPYVRENTFTAAAETVGERGVKPNWDPDLETETANVRKIAVTTKVPDEFMADFAGVQSYLDNRLPYMVDIETEDQVLYGDGSGNNLRGILSTSGVQPRAYATSIAQTIRKAITDVEVTSFFKADGIAFHPYDWETAQLEVDGEGRFLAGGPVMMNIGGGMYMRVQSYWGLPVVTSTSVVQGRPVVGAWKAGAQYFVREGMRIESTNSNEDDFKRNLICLRAEHRLALAVYRPSAFVEVTGLPARS